MRVLYIIILISDGEYNYIGNTFKGSRKKYFLKINISKLVVSKRWKGNEMASAPKSVQRETKWQVHQNTVYKKKREDNIIPLQTESNNPSRKLQSRNRFQIEEVNIASLLWNTLGNVVPFKKITYRFSKGDVHKNHMNKISFDFLSVHRKSCVISKMKNPHHKISLKLREGKIHAAIRKYSWIMVTKNWLNDSDGLKKTLHWGS